MSKRQFWILAAVLCLVLPNVWADVMVVDRGLPAANLNSGAGANRSNVDWAPADPAYFLGDDFTVAGSGSYTINTVRVWFDECHGTTCDLGSIYTTPLSLYGSVDGTPLNLLKSGTFTGGLAVSNPDITVTAVTYAGSGDTQYQSSGGSYWQLWQLDFNNLNWVVPANTKIQFGVQGGAFFYLEASNAAKGGVPADSADGKYLEFQSGNLSALPDAIDSSSIGWDKSSDINVQVFATPEPTSWALLGTAIAGLAFMRRRRG